MDIESYNKDIEFNDNRPAVKLILETSFSKEIRILLKKGQLMKEHKAPMPIVVHLLSGEIDFGIQGNVSRLTAGSIINLQANVPHDLKAYEDSIVRLTISKKDKLEKVEKVTNS